LKKISDDTELVAALQKGDAGAFDRLFGKYANRLFSFGLKYLGSKEDTEGLVQGVFLKVWENREKLKKETSFQSFLFTIAYHDICNIFRRRVTERQLKDNLALEFSEVPNTPDNSSEYNSLLEQIDRLITKLPEQQKAAFMKSRIEGMSAKEIAKELNLSPGTIDNYISATTKFLRMHLKGDNLSILLFMYLWLI
jgi:RNA polymerase sigma-70 factor (family 1)